MFLLFYSLLRLWHHSCTGVVLFVEVGEKKFHKVLLSSQNDQTRSAGLQKV